LEVEAPIVIPEVEPEPEP